MIQDNFIFILFGILSFCIISFAILFYLTDKGDGKRKKLAGKVLFGRSWKYIEKDASRNLSKRETFGFLIVFTLMAGAIFYEFVLKKI